MTSLSSVYDGGVGSVVSRKRRLAGTTLFAFGVALVVAAIPLATTNVGAVAGLSVIEARLFAGVLAGLGVPAVFVGIFAVLPANAPTRAAAAIGASLALLGVVLFAYAYPQRWLAADPLFAVLTMAVYSLGTFVTVWCLFLAVATFKTRNDPGGTARVELTDEGKIRVVRTESSLPGFGSVGLFGRDPDGDVETQTNDDPDEEMVVPEASVSETTPTPSTETQPEPSTAHSGGSWDSATSQSQHPANPTSDGGTAVESSDGHRSPVPEAQNRGNPDKYCGNCKHFEYVRADGDIAPYCGLTDSLMKDMDACRDWSSNK